MAKDCKDAQGNPIDCNSIKGNFKPSDDKSKGAQMKTIRSLNDDQKQWLEDNPNYKGKRKPISEVGEDQHKIYLSPSKNESQTKLLKMQKRGASLLTNTTLKPRDISIEKTPTPGKSTTKEKEYTYTTSSSNKKSNKGKKIKADNNIKGDGLTQCSSDDPTACGLNMAKEIGREKKAEKKAYNKAQKDRSYKVKKDGTQKLKKKFAPGEYFYQKGWRSGRGFGKNVKTILR